MMLAERISEVVKHRDFVKHVVESQVFFKARCYTNAQDETRGGGLGSRPKKMYGERLGDGVEYHLMSPTPRR